MIISQFWGVVKFPIDLCVQDFLNRLFKVIYFIRNILYHTTSSTSFKFSAHPAGLFVYHNTIINEHAVAEPYIRRRAIHHLDKGLVVIFAPIAKRMTAGKGPEAWTARSGVTSRYGSQRSQHQTSPLPSA